MSMSLQPVTFAHYDVAWGEYDKSAKTQGMDKADALLLNEAKSLIFKSTDNLFRYIAWTIPDELRLFGLTSVMAPAISIESHFESHKTLGPVKFTALLLMAALQLFWWAGCLAGILKGYKKIGPTFLYVLAPLLYLAFVHAPLDNVSRFSSPVQPILGACFAFAIFNTYLHKPEQKNP